MSSAKTTKGGSPMANIVPELEFTDKYLSERWSRVKEDFWGDLKEEQLRALKRLLETSMEIEVQDLIGARKWEHRSPGSIYRNGCRYRSILSSFGYLANIKVPRIRSGTIDFRCIDAYARRAPDVDRTVLEMFLNGVSTRKVSEVFEPLFGLHSISATAVSKITKSLNNIVNKHHARKLSDDYLYLIADGIYFNIKNPVEKKRRCVLVVYGINSTGKRELIDFHLASHGESQAAWELFLNRLYHRGLEGKHLRLIVRDGNGGLKNALSTVFPMVAQQPCWAHKLRNVSNKLHKHTQASCISQAREIYNADNYESALKLFRCWAKNWHIAEPSAVKCLIADIDDLLNFFKEPEHLWKKLRTTNIIERCFREVRRRTRPMSCFQNNDSVHRIIYAIFNKLNKSWESKPLKITHNT